MAFSRKEYSKTYYPQWKNKDGSGIYKMVNTDTNECLYVGSSKILTKRLSDHKTFIKNPPKYENSWKYFYQQLITESNITLSILEQCSIELLPEREQYYKDLLKPKYNKNKNICH